MTQSKYIDHSTHFAHIDDDIDLQLVEKTEAYARNASEHIAGARARIGNANRAKKNVLRLEGEMRVY